MNAAAEGPGPRRGPGRPPWPVLAAVALGGGLGAAGRYGAGRLWPVPPHGFPWTTFGVNALGCALIGVLMVVVTEARTAHPLVRPFLGTGVLGGFTTFSTYALDVERLMSDGHPRPALAYLILTPAAALTAVWLAAAATRRLTVRRAR
ncbi:MULTISPECIES: fluoride efflux transporter CrcB [unclassified Streptomyces]|uniref:Fluoride-specific ion channel FluC n=1 Tax=Streptomyces johnsoniae TaxID=3075532 RepID=A0ABU2SD16_9ACTN|nr:MULTISPECIES: fluoride efflux transporter CrcB [unclassified Streptomyces]MDT0446845.1 fluoride efflux transporter CrcB [Streptomyces sp. DSM 41886]ONK12369.1 camphor resistance protein CrcB [Streptomyces sp. MP131-18]